MVQTRSKKTEYDDDDNTNIYVDDEIDASFQEISEARNSTVDNIDELEKTQGLDEFQNEEIPVKNNQTTHRPSPLSQFLTEARETISNHVLTRVEDNNSEQDVNINSRSLAPEHESENDQAADCPICKSAVSLEDQGLECDRCNSWFHASCLFINNEEYASLGKSNVEWFCDSCRAIRANRIKWGDLEGEDDISDAITSAYEEIIRLDGKRTSSWYPGEKVVQILSRN